jgi:hypothetical protein
MHTTTKMVIAIIPTKLNRFSFILSLKRLSLLAKS